MQEIFFIIFLVLMFLIIILELFFCFIENEKYRKLFKCFPLILIAFLTLLAPNKNNYLIIVPIFYAIGDYFLLTNDKKKFIIGSLSFLIGHFILIFNIVIKLNINSLILIYSLIPFIISMILVFIFFYTKLGKKFIFGGMIYLSILIYALSIVTLNLLINKASIFSILLIVGLIIYFISDIMVILKRFGNFKYKKDFFIMLTYYLANLFLFSFFFFII